MKVLLSLVLILFASSAVCTIEHLLLAQPSEISKMLGDAFPIQFSVNGTATSFTGVTGNAIFRFDGDRNIFSYNITYYNSGTGRNQSDNIAHDFNHNRTYITSTIMSQCINDDLRIQLPKPGSNLIDAMNKAWFYNTTIIDEKYIAGHHMITYKTTYNYDWNVTSYTLDNVFYKINGTIAGEYSEHDITSYIIPRVFSLYDHIPRSCF